VYSYEKSGEMNKHLEALQPSFMWWKSPLIWCLVLGLLARVTWYVQAQHLSFFYAHVQDSALYHELALRILADGVWLSEPFTVAPLYAYFLAGVYSIVGPDPTNVYLLQIGLSLVTVLLTVRLGERVFGLWGAWAGGLMAALYPVAILYDVRLLSVGWGTFLTVLGATAVHHAWLHGRARYWMLAGLTLGVGAMARGNLLLVAPFLVLAAMWSASGKQRVVLPLALLVGLWLGVSPSTIHNREASDTFIPVSLGGGINLYRGNNPHFEDSAVHPFRLPAKRDGLTTKSRLIASIDSGELLDDVETDRFWVRRTLGHFTDDPLRGLGLILRKTTQVLGPVEVGDHMDLAGMVDRSPVLRWVPPLVLPMSVFGLLGLVVTARRKDGALALFVVGGVLSVALFFVVSRYRTPLMPLVGIYAGGGMAWLFQQCRERHWRQVGLATVSMVVVAGSLMLPATHEALPWNWMAGVAVPMGECAADQHVRRSEEVEARFEIGVFALDHGRWADAEEAMWSVLKEDEGHTAAGVNLAWLLLKKGAVVQSAEVSRKVVRQDPCDDKGWANLATAMLRLQRFGPARNAAEKAAKIDPYNPGYTSTLAETMLALGRKEEAVQLFETALRWQPDLWQAQARLGRLALESGDYLRASQLLQPAVRSQPGRQELVGMLGLAELGRGNREGAQSLLQAAVKNGLNGPVLVALARAMSAPTAVPIATPAK
jgi:Flp pilus assembly protein TadD